MGPDLRQRGPGTFAPHVAFTLGTAFILAATAGGIGRQADPREIGSNAFEIGMGPGHGDEYIGRQIQSGIPGAAGSRIDSDRVADDVSSQATRPTSTSGLHPARLPNELLTRQCRLDAGSKTLGVEWYKLAKQWIGGTGPLSELIGQHYSSRTCLRRQRHTAPPREKENLMLHRWIGRQLHSRPLELIVVLVIVLGPLSLMSLGPRSAEGQNEPFEVVEATMEDIHQAYTARQLTARQLVQLYLDRIEAYDKQGPGINAIISINSAALPEADRLDAAFETSGFVGPLHGIPVIQKDQMNAAGMRTTLGSILFEDYYPDGDAFVIEQLRAAGAIILGKATLGELGGGDTHGSLFGSTRNPLWA